MKCAVCRNGTTDAGFVTIALEKNASTLVFRNVPADICNNCGEEYVSADTSATLLRRANEAARPGIDLELLRFAA
ncbi:MAG: type II toxin-antitoxin system MqsA family antitoxin [Chitinispirillaceae bacterium]|nr:type II toxin-antitoxin system MqsA family antitoxin [Chitinispirillaceae bacterium]